MSDDEKDVFGKAAHADGSEDEGDGRTTFEQPIECKDGYTPTPESSGLSGEERYRKDMDMLPEANDVKKMYLDMDSWADALLKGMKRTDGSRWQEGEGLQASSGMVEAVVPVPRQRGAGLGSEASEMFEKKTRSKSAFADSKTYMTVKDKLVAKKVVEPGREVVIAEGAHAGFFATVVSFPDGPASQPRKQDMITLHLKVSGAELKVPFAFLRLPTERDRLLQAEAKDGASRKRDRDDSKAAGSARSKRPRKDVPLRWVIKPGMVVRVIDVELDGGAYYHKKLPVCDIESMCAFSLKTEGGKVLDGIREDQVETTVPRGVGDMLLILVGSKKGRRALLVSRDKKRQEVTVRFEGSMTKTYVYSFDDICAM